MERFCGWSGFKELPTLETAEELWWERVFTFFFFFFTLHQSRLLLSHNQHGKTSSDKLTLSTKAGVIKQCVLEISLAMQLNSTLILLCDLVNLMLNVSFTKLSLIKMRWTRFGEHTIAIEFPLLTFWVLELDINTPFWSGIHDLTKKKKFTHGLTTWICSASYPS